MVVNQDSFFLSHRLPLALGARRRGMNVVVMAGESGAGQAIRDQGFEFLPLPISRSGLNPFADTRTIGTLLRTYRRLRPALIHHSTVKPVIYGSITARAVRTAAVVNTISGLGYAFTSGDLTARMLRPALRVLWRVALSHPRSRVIFQNPDDRDDFVRLGLVREQSTVLISGSGVDCDQFSPSTEPAGVPVVALPARMLWDKGVQEFIDAARLLRDRGVSARFVLVGAPDPGNRAAVPEILLKQWVSEGHIEWWGHRSDMPTVLAAASIVVLPTYGEGLPKVLLEAGAAGRAMITTNVRGCREVVRAGVNGLLVPPRDSKSLASAIESLIQAPELRERLGRAGRRIAETEFAESVIVKQTVDLYEELLRTTNAVRP